MLGKNLTGVPLSPAADALGLGAQLQSQVVGETEEQRKKRMLAQRGMQPSPEGSLAVPALFGVAGAGW